MAKIKTYTFEVRGSGAFPLDMLRYDCCWPTNSMSIERMSWCHHDREEYLTPRTVTLARSGEREPTAGRWASFGWPIVKVEGR